MKLQRWFSAFSSTSVLLAVFSAVTQAQVAQIAPAPAAHVTLTVPAMPKPIETPQVRITAIGPNLNVTSGQLQVRIEQPVRQVVVRSNPPTVIRPSAGRVEIQQGDRRQVVNSVVVSGGGKPPGHIEEIHPHAPHQEGRKETRCYLDSENRFKCYTIWVPK